MVDGRCLGPHCLRLITFRSPSPWFCSELCDRSYRREVQRRERQEQRAQRR